MKVIDADAHVIENESTWDYMLESEKAFRPKIVGAANGKDAFDYWMIDGRVIPRNNVGRDLPKESREMSDLSARIKHMDELGIDVQVIYPTIFITPVSRRPDIDLAVSRSYNRWMADIVKKQPDRFRWVLVPPLQSHGTSVGGVEVRQREWRLRRLLARPGVRAQSQRSLFLLNVRTGERAGFADLRALGQRCVYHLRFFCSTIRDFLNSNSPSSARFIRWCFTPSRSVSRS